MIYVHLYILLLLAHGFSCIAIDRSEMKLKTRKTGVKRFLQLNLMMSQQLDVFKQISYSVEGDGAHLIRLIIDRIKHAGTLVFDAYN